MHSLFRSAPRLASPRDPIDHPALRAMSLRELADLPMPRPSMPPSESAAGAERFTTAPVRGTGGHDPGHRH
jgi:hypothetical protein